MSLVSASAVSATTDAVRASLTRTSRDTKGTALLIGLIIGISFTLLVLFTLLAQIVVSAIPVFQARGLSFVTDTIGSDPAEIGIWPGFFGSILIGITVVIVAIPMGIAAAVYLEEYAHQSKMNTFIAINIRNLAGVPAVIYGVLGLALFAGFLRPITNGKTVIAAGLTLSVLVLPIVIITASEAIRAVPQGLRDAGYGVGASRWEVTRDHVLPYALPGILTGTVLSLARALGEAAPLIIIGAITGLLPRTSLDGPFTAIPMLIYNWSGRPDVSGTDISWSNVAAAASLVLLVLVLSFNIVAVVLRNKYEKKRVGT
jgi:phosphate transport system permease protein